MFSNGVGTAKSRFWMGSEVLGFCPNTASLPYRFRTIFAEESSVLAVAPLNAIESLIL